MEQQVPQYDEKQSAVNPHALSGSSVLQSNSRYLNDPRLREWVSTESLRRNGRDYNHYGGVLDLLHIMEDLVPSDQVNALFAEARQRDHALDQWLDDRYLEAHDLVELRLLPADTLGHGYAAMLDEQRLTPDFLPDGGIETDYDYYKRRSQQTHDIEHVVTGFRYDPIGEFALIVVKGVNLLTYLGVELGGLLNVYSQFLLTTGLTRISLHYPQMLLPTLKAMAQAEKVGREMQPIYLPKYETMFDWPLDDVRDCLGVQVPVDQENTLWSLEAYFDP